LVNDSGTRNTSQFCEIAMRIAGCGWLLGCLLVSASAADEASDTAAVVKQLQQLDGRVIVLGTVRQPPLAAMLSRHAEAQLRAANRADREAWSRVKSLQEWQAFRERCMQSLQNSLGKFPAVPSDLKTRVTGSHTGDGFRVDNLVFVSRPGLVVTANLYRPIDGDKGEQKKLPGIILCHSHQSTKHSGWRQDMAMTWARAGCVVLVPDHLGHGERRQHPFGGEGQHDYHFRYDAALQLHLVGESLMGWLVWDLMRGVDVLLAQPNVDSKRILLISEPAGGGDVAAVTAAFDPRITCAMVQNFGGPQPETPYPLPSDAEESFAYAGSGSWESTRNLKLSARDGFLPWSIVAAIAPRQLIYYHEFYWDREQDPVWKRLQQVFRWHDRGNSLVGLAGRGFVVGSAPENTHWLPESRALLYPVLERWQQIPSPKQEYSQRLSEADLHCLTPEVSRALGAQPLHMIVNHLATQRIEAANQKRATLPSPALRAHWQQVWRELLGPESSSTPNVIGESLIETAGDLSIERIQLRTEPGIVVPVLLLRIAKSKGQKIPLVIGLAQHGKQAFLKHRADVIAELLNTGAAVCLLDVRGTGETSPGEDRGRRSTATSVSASELMLGQTVLGGQLHDVRAVLRHFRSRADLDSRRIAVWGESFTPLNQSDVRYELPHNAADRPPSPEPLGGLLALLTALFEDEVRAVYVHRGLGDFRSALNTPFCYLPHDAVIPGVLAHSDLPDLANSLAPRKVWLQNSVDVLNRTAAAEEARDDKKIAQWLLTELRR
jgi:dienelactone hydrolase